MSGVVGSLMLLMAPLGAEGASAKPPSAQEIAAAVARLGSNRFTEREAATELLWHAGDAAQTALEAAVKSDDAEVVNRAELLLERIRWGIGPGSPPEALLLVKTFQIVENGKQAEVIRELRKIGCRDTAMRLLLSIGSPFPKAIALEMAEELRAATVEAIMRGDREAAERNLREESQLDVDYLGDRDLGAFLLLTDRLDQEIAEVRRLYREKPSPPTALRLARLLVVSGDYDEAVELVKKNDALGIETELAVRRGDWPAVIAATSSLMHPIEAPGFAAIFNHFAGNRAAVDAAVAKLHEHAVAKPDEAWMAAEAAMLTDRWDVAERILAASPRQRFELQCGELEIRKALDELGWNAANANKPWFETPPKSLKRGDPESDRFYAGMAVLPVLRRLGETAAADRLADELAAVDYPENEPWIRTALIEAERKSGRRERVESLIEQTIDNEKAVYSIMYQIYSQRARIAAGCWRYLRTTEHEETFATHWLRLQTLMTHGEPQPFNAAELEQFAAVVESGLPDGSRRKATALATVADFCRMHEDYGAAAGYYERQFEAEPTNQTNNSYDASPPERTVALIRLGDVHFARRDWSAAAAAYERAWRTDTRFPLPAYLMGRAIAEGGDAVRGKELMDIAVIVPLANSVRRRSLAEGLAERGLTDAAQEQWRLVVRLGPQYGWEGATNWAVEHAYFEIAKHIDKTNPAEAADFWRRIGPYLVKTNTSLNGTDGYREMSMLIHRADARRLLDEGKVAEAAAELRAAHEIRPSYELLVEEFVPLLESAGASSEAEALFAAAYAKLDAVCIDFPQSAYYHNNLAWMAARCDRRLDDALTHAEEAVRLQPERAAYLDTLAEVCFRRGERERAIELAERALKLEPKSKHLNEQLARFRDGS